MIKQSPTFLAIGTIQFFLASCATSPAMEKLVSEDGQEALIFDDRNFYFGPNLIESAETTLKQSGHEIVKIGDYCTKYGIIIISKSESPESTCDNFKFSMREVENGRVYSGYCRKIGLPTSCPPNLISRHVYDYWLSDDGKLLELTVNPATDDAVRFVAGKW